MRTATLALAGALLLAGCVSQPAPARFTAEASSPVAMLGYDYPAATARPGEGRITIDVDPSADAGNVTATFALDNRTMRVVFEQFLGTQPFHQGGIRNDFPEHGTSGNGDPLLPTIHALSAGWGTGRATFDGQPFVDPASGSEVLNLHYMVTDTAPRSPEDYRVLKADGQGLYDPANPGDARLHQGTLQVLLNVQGSGPPMPPDADFAFGDTVTGPGYSREHTFEVNASQAHVMLNFTVGSPAPPPAPATGVLSFVVRDGNGTAVGAWDYNAPGTLPGEQGASLDVHAPYQTGTFTVEVTGHGAALSYGIAAHVDYPERTFLHVVYTQVRLG